MNLITKAEFGRRAGITRQSVARAIKTGKIFLTGKGTKSKIDMDDAENIATLQAYQNRKAQLEAEAALLQAPPPPEEKPKKKAGKTKGKKNHPTPPPLLPPVAPPVPEPLSVDELDDDQKAALSYSSANRLKTLAQIHQIEIKTDKERQKLIDRDLVESLFHKLYAIDVNEWRTLGPNLAPELAAIFKIDDPEALIRIEELIDKKVFLTLQHVKHMVNSFLKDIDAEQVEEIIEAKKED